MRLIVRTYEAEPRHPCLRVLPQRATARFTIPLFAFVLKIPYWRSVRVYRLLNEFASARGPGWHMAVIRIGLFPGVLLDRLRVFSWDRVFYADHPETDPRVDDPFEPFRYLHRPDPRRYLEDIQ